MLRTILPLRHQKYLFLRLLSSSSVKNTPIICDIDLKTGFQTVNLNNPPVNSLSSELLTSLDDTFSDIAKDKDVRGVIIKSLTPGRAFCAGLNLEELCDKGEKYYKEYWYKVQNWYFAVYGCKKPVVSVINGHAPAGGCAMALMSDYRVLMKDCKIGLNETKVGIAPPIFISHLLMDGAGTRVGEYGLIAGKMFSCQEALDAGIVDRIFPTEEEMISEAEKQLNEFCSVPATAFASTKMLLRGKNIEHLTKIRDKDASVFAETVNTKQVQDMIGNYLSNLKSRKKK